MAKNYCLIVETLRAGDGQEPGVEAVYGPFTAQDILDSGERLRAFYGGHDAATVTTAQLIERLPRRRVT